MSKQKKIFWDYEGDAWYTRNQKNQNEDFNPKKDKILPDLLEIPLQPGMKVLEIGCSSCQRLLWLEREFQLDCSGIDPSQQAISIAKMHGAKAYQATADALPFEDSMFDILIFGFCLYLCDRSDLFRIALEADRVLKSPG